METAMGERVRLKTTPEMRALGAAAGYAERYVDLVRKVA
jgi:hypothetical protein